MVELIEKYYEADKRNKYLTDNLLIMNEKILDLLDEKERLENIINELEKWLKDYIGLFDKPDMLEEQTLEDLKEVLNKMRELEENNK